MYLFTEEWYLRHFSICSTMPDFCHWGRTMPGMDLYPAICLELHIIDLACACFVCVCVPMYDSHCAFVVLCLSPCNCMALVDVSQVCVCFFFFNYHNLSVFRSINVNRWRNRDRQTDCRDSFTKRGLTLSLSNNRSSSSNNKTPDLQTRSNSIITKMLLTPAINLPGPKRWAKLKLDLICPFFQHRSVALLQG